jgi:hypothetical protein
MTNCRLKDYLDLWVLLSRETIIVRDTLVGLTNKFANDASRNILWGRFLEKNQIPAKSLDSIIDFIRTALEPIIKLAIALSDDE